MPSMFKKRNLHLCFFKIQCLPSSFSPNFTHDDEDDDHDYDNNNYPHNVHTNNRRVSPSHIRTTSNDHKNTTNQQEPIMMKNYNSMYDVSTPCSTTFTATTTTTETSTDYCRSPEFDTIFDSNRFFASSPGRSNSILDSSTASSIGDSDKQLVRGGVPVKKYSSDPYTDFKRSMTEMIEAKEYEMVDKEVTNDEWEFLQELLLCYLNLNPKSTHKLIIRAFSDVVVSMISDTHGLGQGDESRYKVSTI